MEKTEMARETAESFLSLTEFLLDIDCLDELTRKASKINIFDVLKISRTEIRHSNMLDWLLDPNENHGFGDAVLRRFIQFAAPQNEEFMIQKKLKSSPKRFI